MIDIKKKLISAAALALLLTSCACGTPNNRGGISNQDNIYSAVTNAASNILTDAASGESKTHQETEGILDSPLTALEYLTGIGSGKVIEEIRTDNRNVCLVYKFSDGKIINYRMEKGDDGWSVLDTAGEEYTQKYRKTAEYLRKATAQRLRLVTEDADSADPYKNIYELSDDFILLGTIEENDTALYGLYGGSAMVMRIGDKTYPVWRMWSDRNVMFDKGDYDNDGDIEYIYSTCEAYGTGMYIEGVHIFEINDDDTLTVHDFRDVDKHLERIDYRYDSDNGVVYWIIDGKELEKPHRLTNTAPDKKLTGLNFKLQRSVFERGGRLYFEILAAAEYNSDGVIDYEDQLCLTARIVYRADGSFGLEDIE